MFFSTNLHNHEIDVSAFYLQVLQLDDGPNCLINMRGSLISAHGFAKKMA